MSGVRLMATGITLVSESRRLGQSLKTRQNQVKPTRAYRPVIDQAVAQVFAISLVELSRQSRGRANVALARQVAMYLAHVACGLTFTDIGQLFGRDRTTVAHACSLVEDRRDDPMFDTVVELLESAVLNMLCFEPRQELYDADSNVACANGPREHG